MTTGLAIAEADAGSAEAAGLIAALDAELEERYPGLTIHGIEAEGFRESGGVFLLGRVEGVAVACGAIRPLGGGVAEVKRMFVVRQHRGRGHSRAMLAALEGAAAARGFRRIRLETGIRQPEAIGLYESAGYLAIPCYEEFIEDPRSRCFEKALG